MLDWQSINFGQQNKDFNFKDMELIKKVRRLSRKHQRQSCNSCNGYGYVNGQVYYSGTINDYTKQKNGVSVKSAYVNGVNEGTIFDKEMLKIEEKIYKLVYQFNHEKYALWRVKPFKVEIQGDPRGATVKLTYDNYYIEL